MDSNKAIARAAYAEYMAHWRGKSPETGHDLPAFDNLNGAMQSAWINVAAVTVDAYEKATDAPALPDDATKRIAESLARLLRRDPQCDLARAIREVLA